MLASVISLSYMSKQQQTPPHNSSDDSKPKNPEPMLTDHAPEPNNKA